MKIKSAEDAIKYAFGAGYRDKYFHDNIGPIYMAEEFERIFLDPLFWQSVSKAIGWKDRICYEPIKTPTILTEHDWIRVPSGENKSANRLAG